MRIIKKKSNKPEYWVTNISTEYDVSLSDLRLTIRRGRTVNLLDDKHYSYTIEQLKESAEKGSIKKKSSVIKVCEFAPKPTIPMVLESSADYHQLRRQLNAVSIDEPYYPELDVNPIEDSKIDDDMSDVAYHDHAPVLPVDDKYKKKASPIDDDS